jgi:hypothetical protein
MELGGTARTIPEAYRIEITFTSLLMPTRNIMRALEKGRKVEAISDIAPFRSIAERTLNVVSEGDISTDEAAGNFINNTASDTSNLFNNPVSNNP